jgi:hypothetical protein
MDAATGMGTLGRVAIALGCVLALSTCASAPPVANCPARELQNPAPTLECLAETSARKFLLDSGHEVGDVLMGWRAQPGGATLALSFDSDSAVDSVCLREREGLVQADRIRRAAARLQSSQAPSCFAGRRVEFAWESPTVTAWQIREAELQCNSDARPIVRVLEMCRTTQTCQKSEIYRLERQADEHVERCVLQRVPISIVATDTPDVALFLPVSGTQPAAKDALESLEACDSSDRLDAGVSCMAARGWRRIN